MNNATPALATVIGTNSNTTTGNITGRDELPPLTETQSKSKMKNEKDKKFIGLMHPKREVLKHPAGEELLKYATEGCPVDCGTDWTIDQLEAAIKMGPCQSASTPAASKACRREALERVKEGSCRLVKWNDIKHNPPKNLKISPIAAIPHKSRDYRMILNLAYNLKLNKKKLPSVNETTNREKAPQHAMYELGNVIPRIIWTMATSPDNGVPILFSKIDLKDGYWRMCVNEKDAWNFAYVLPKDKEEEEIQLVIPDALQMGWCESPAFFCAATETVRDVAENYHKNKTQLQEHPNEKTILDIDWDNLPEAKHEPDNKFLTLLEVYIVSKESQKYILHYKHKAYYIILTKKTG